jgi:hypothetical protein
VWTGTIDHDEHEYAWVRIDPAGRVVSSNPLPGARAPMLADLDGDQRDELIAWRMSSGSPDPPVVAWSLDPGRDPRAVGRRAMMLAEARSPQDVERALPFIQAPFVAPAEDSRVEWTVLSLQRATPEQFRALVPPVGLRVCEHAYDESLEGDWRRAIRCATVPRAQMNAVVVHSLTFGFGVFAEYEERPRPYGFVPEHEADDDRQWREEAFRFSAMTGWLHCAPEGVRVRCGMWRDDVPSSGGHSPYWLFEGRGARRRLVEIGWWLPEPGTGDMG